RLPDGDGLTLLQEIKKQQPELQVIMLTGHGTLESAIEAMKAGAFDYLTKPCNLSELELTLQKALEQRKLLVENTGLKQVVHRQNTEPQIIGSSLALQSLMELTRKIAQTDTPVLLQGESGTGKDLFARALHTWSPRSSQAYIPLNSGAVQENLMESELFGHGKGAFTGASSVKLGLVEMADQGTLFLDEIGEMSLNLQVKLLRFMETGEFRRVGDNRLRRVDVRIVAATNRNLLEEVEGGTFRKDLYYRLSGMIIEIPPLRERKEDILELAEFFLQKESKNPPRGKNLMGEKNLRLNSEYKLSPEAKEALLAYDFPGNVRELAHLMERGKILAEGNVIKLQDLWPNNQEKGFQDGSENTRDGSQEEQNLERNRDNESSSGGPNNLAKDNYLEDSGGNLENYPTLADLEKRHILATLEKVQGNRNQAAKLLGISVRNLYRKIDEYNRS
ncbi:MAG: sigma-54-dependent Fis family transcriptional regulator, partial [Desulfitobacterium sp.]|nr:sigma-54-dependent Fis family transcriptional regulator [Desulfitobacterium sp.]